MVIIKVIALMRNANGDEEIFGGETGSTEFYMVKHTLEEYLGNELLLYDDHDNFSFVIENGELVLYNEDNLTDKFIIETRDESCDTTENYISIIESIRKPFDRNRQLRFEIDSVVYKSITS